MARYERDYGLDYGRRNYGGFSPWGMRGEGWGSAGWRGYGEGGWGAEGPEGFRGDYYDHGYRGEQGFGGGYGGFQSGYAGYGELQRGGYGGDYGRGFSRDMGYGGRHTGYMEGWQDQRGGMGTGTWRQSESGWNRPRAAEIMTENPHVVTPDATISEVAQKMRDLDVGIIPVVESTDNPRLRGVITDRDITVRAVAEGKNGNAKVAECMTDRVRAVNKNDSIQDVMWVMRREQVRRVPVTDREGRLVGIIAQADLAVDYAADDRNRETEVGETIERISEPARPDGGSTRMAAAGARGSTNTERDGSTRGRSSNRPRSTQVD